jgi:hypothetical protein
VALGSILALVFLPAMRHATDADHLAAVATLATRPQSVAHTVVEGIAWGTGHTLTQMLIGGGAVLVLGALVPAQAAQALELAVGVAHFHAHSHRVDGGPHDAARHEHHHPRAFPTRALLVGMVHEMAGSAALVLLSLEALRSPAWGFVYIATFGLGSILGMAALSAAIAVPLRLSSRHLARTYGALSAGVAVATVLLGCCLVYRIGVGDGPAG